MEMQCSVSERQRGDSVGLSRDVSLHLGFTEAECENSKSFTVDCSVTVVCTGHSLSLSLSVSHSRSLFLSLSAINF